MKDKKQEEFNLTKSLRGWREERNINSITRETYVNQIIEELFEMYGLEKEQVKQNTKGLYSSWFSHLESREVDTEVLLDGCLDVNVFSTNYVELLGYNQIKASEEVFKEISSRKQDPKQKALWESDKGLNQKWQKDQNQDKDTLYQADFSNCKLDN